VYKDKNVDHIRIRNVTPIMQNVLPLLLTCCSWPKKTEPVLRINQYWAMGVKYWLKQTRWPTLWLAPIIIAR